MADRDIQIGSCNGGRCFHNIPVAVVGFGNHFLGLCFGSGGYFIHLPENIFQNRLFGIVYRGDLLCIVGVSGGLDRINGKHFRPHGAGAGHFQNIIGNIRLCRVKLRLIVSIDFLNNRLHSLT